MKTINVGVHIEHPSNLLAKTSFIAEAVQEDGFCLIEGWDTNADSLVKIASHFGNAQSHIRANNFGVTGTSQSQDISWKNHPLEYQAIKADVFHPHTDGSFIGGITMKDGKAITVRPPKMMFLQCVKSAGNGGENILLDAKLIHTDLVRDNPDVAKILSTAGCVHFSRDDLMATARSIFEIDLKGKCRIRYRYDEKMLCSDWSLDAVRFFHKNYISNPKYQIIVPLKERQILVLDNFRVLHGRRPFTVKGDDPLAVRKLHRLWIFDDDDIALTPVDGEIIESRRCMDPFFNYRPIPSCNIVHNIACGFMV